MDKVYQNSNIVCLKKASQEMSLPFEEIDKFGNFISVKLNGKSFKFIHYWTPFNNSSTARLSKDKAFTYDWFKNKINMPKTLAYLNPRCEEKYKIFLTHKNIKEITEDIQSKINLPCVVKMNTGYQGLNVFLCKDSSQIKRSLKKIFNKKSLNYDYLAIAQEAIDIKKEFRLIWFRGKILLVYEKIWSNKDKSLSPLHNENSYTEIIEDDNLIYQEISNFIYSCRELNEIEYSGIDIALDQNGKWFLVELNDHPGFNIFTGNHGLERIVKLYKDIFGIILNNE